MNVKKYIEQDDYEDIKKWAEEISETAPPKYILPEGCIIEENGQKLACGFLYLSVGTCVSVIEWCFCNPEITVRKKHEALNMVIDALEFTAKELEHPFMMTGTTFSGIAKQYLKRGWKISGMGVMHMIKEAKGV